MMLPKASFCLAYPAHLLVSSLSLPLVFDAGLSF
jgi:hypothetical protein